MLLLLYDLTSFDIIMIKISDVSYWNHSEHRGLTNRIRRNAKITKIEMWNTIGWNIKMRIVSAFFDFLVE